MKALTKMISLILAVVICITAAGCRDEENEENRDYNEEEVRLAAKELIADSTLLNEIYWGKGIPYVDDISFANGSYYPADEKYLENIGISTIEDLKNLTRGTFSDEMSEWVFSTVLSSVSDGSVIAGTARYGQKWGGEMGDEPEYIMVQKDYEYLLTDTVEYHLDNIEVLRSEGELVIVRLLATVTNEEGDIMNDNIEVALIEEEDGWRLDSPTYLKYYFDPS